MGQIPVGVLLPVFGTAENQCPRGKPLPRYCQNGFSILPEVQQENGIQEAVRQAQETFRGYLQIANSSCKCFHVQAGNPAIES